MQITVPLTMLRDSDKINKNKKIEKIFKKMLSMVMAMCYI